MLVSHEYVQKVFLILKFSFKRTLISIKIKVKPTPLKSPSLVVYSKSAMALIDLDDKELEVFYVIKRISVLFLH